MKERTDRRAYYVYVIELDSAAGERIRPDRPIVYVGQSIRPPEERFDQHMRGHKASKVVKKHGVRLKPRLYRSLNPFWSRADAEAAESRLAHRLIRRGYRVFWG